MGWAIGDGGGSGGGSRKPRAGSADGGGGGTHDIRSLLGEKRPREETGLALQCVPAPLAHEARSSSRPVCDSVPSQSSQDSMASEAPPACSEPPDGGTGRSLEMQTRSQLMAAGFPPEVARRAASAYPTDVERAADWILMSNEW